MNANDYPYNMEPMSQYQMVRDWLEAFGKPLDAPFSVDQILLASKCIREEADEVLDEAVVVRFGPPEAQNNPDLYTHTNYPDKAALTKELCDLLWVTYQFAAFFGLPIEAAFKRVYENNMTKLQTDGTPLLREDGKILKPAHYKPVDLSDLFHD